MEKAPFPLHRVSRWTNDHYSSHAPLDAAADSSASAAIPRVPRAPATPANRAQDYETRRAKKDAGRAMQCELTSFLPRRAVRVVIAMVERRRADSSTLRDGSVVRENQPQCPESVFYASLVLLSGSSTMPWCIADPHFARRFPANFHLEQMTPLPRHLSRKKGWGGGEKKDTRREKDSYKKKKWRILYNKLFYIFHSFSFILSLSNKIIPIVRLFHFKNVVQL